MVAEKIQALLDRKKPRDYYDLYFLLRHPQLNAFVNKKSLNIVANQLKKESIDFRRELSTLLPVSHHLVLRDFKGLLKKEMDRYS
jgi:predicted nucleotidyltransferase component of viral defense system